MFSYSKEVIDHFRKPRNIGEIKNPSGIGRAGNLICGDVIWLYIKVDKGKITDIKFKTLGCTVAIAVSSIITALAKGKTLKAALQIKKDAILKVTGQLPISKIHCSVLADDALHEAIYNYLTKNNLPVPEDLQKKHERVSRDLERVEEHHRDYVELEKRVLNK